MKTNKTEYFITNSKNIIHRDLSYQIMAAIFGVHEELGPGFLKSVYKKALVLELINRGMKVGAEKVFDLAYKGKKVGTHRLDLSLRIKLCWN